MTNDRCLLNFKCFSDAMLPRKALTALALSLAAACSPPEQDTGAAPMQTIDESAVCRDCEIGFRTVAVLGNDGDPGSAWHRAAGDGCMVAQLSTGDFVLGAVAGGGELFVYDSDGRFVRGLGRSGQGPGEVQGMVRIWAGPGDTLFVADDGNNRMQALTSRGDYVRSFPMPRPFRRFARLSTGDFVFAKSLGSAGDDMFVLLDASGRETETFGPSKSAEPDLESAVASPRPGTSPAFWTASRRQYAVHEWRLTQAPGPAVALVRTLVREADWFPPYPEFSDEVYESVPPPPLLHHVWEDEDGLLWTYSLVPDPGWRPDIPLSPRPTWHRETFDHRVEVLDPSSGRLVAVGEHEDRLSPVCGSRLMYAVVETPAGDMRVRVVEPHLALANGPTDR